MEVKKDTNTIDMITVKKDGTIELVIVLFRDIDIENSAEEQTALLDKVENYLNYLESQEFTKDFPDGDRTKAVIVLKMFTEPSDVMKNWMGKINDWVRSEGFGYAITADPNHSTFSKNYIFSSSLKQSRRVVEFSH